jgi:hypothetical protein
MSELDDAIREHLELKRRHGARDAELKELEDEAFGTGERPLDPFKAAAEAQVKGGEEGEAPPATPEGASDAPPDFPDAVAEAETSISEPFPDPPSTEEPKAESPVAEPPVDEAPATEEPAAEEPAPPPPPSPDTPIPPPPPQPDRASEVVHQPTEEHPPPEPPSEELAEAAEEFEEEFGAVSSAPEPAAEPAAEEPEGDGGSMLYDFETDAAPPAPPEAPAEPSLPEEPRAPLEPPPAGFDDDFEERPPLPDPAESDDAFSDLGPAESGQGGELPLEDDELPPEEALSHDAEDEPEDGPGAVTADTSEREALDPTEQYTLPAEEPAPQFEDEAEVEEEAPPATGEEPEEEAEDVLEEKPDFLEETPEGEDDLWFEKKPPKDFDFEDD